MAIRTCDTESVLPQLLESGAYTDLTIRCGDFEFLVHKSVICMQSGYFRMACEEAKWKEGSTGMITLEGSDDVIEGDDPYAVSLMITFLYENDYRPQVLQPASPSDEHERTRDLGLEDEAQIPKSPSEEALVNGDQIRRASKKSKKARKKSAASRKKDSSEEEMSPARSNASIKSFLATHAKVFALGSKYDIPHLQKRSLAKFQAAARSWSNDELIDSILIAFNTAPDNNSLRIAIKAMITQNSARLTDDSAFEDAVGRIDGLAFELLKLQTHYSGGQRICLGCNVFYRSRCVAEGCPSTFGGSHICDRDSVCTNCHYA